MSLSLNFPTINPSLMIDFVNRSSLDSRVTFTRGSSATFFDSSGVITTAAANVPRFDHNPSTLAPLGLLIEEQRTNSIRNNTMQGAAAGTPGTLPTNWPAGSQAGLTREIVGFGTVNGISYVDIRYHGTTNATFGSINWETNTQISAANGQTWTASAWVGIVAGSTANITTLNLQVRFNAADTSLLTSQTINFLSTSSTFQRVTNVFAATNASTAHVNSSITIGLLNASAVDFTLRIGLPQLEQGAFATSVIPTTTTALTRSADVASMTGTNFSSWYSAAEGTLFAQSTCFAPTSAFSRVASIETNVSANIISVQRNGADSRGFGPLVSLNQGTNTFPINTVVKQALAGKLNDFALATNGSSAVVDTSTDPLPAASGLGIGISLTNTAPLNGHIQRISFWPVRLANATLQALTA